MCCNFEIWFEWKSNVFLRKQHLQCLAKTDNDYMTQVLPPPPLFFFLSEEALQ